VTTIDKVLEFEKRIKIASKLNVLPGVSSSQEPDKLVEVMARNELGFVKQKHRFIVSSLPALNSISGFFVPNRLFMFWLFGLHEKICNGRGQFEF
jgi:hypothetical protein